MMDIIPVIDVQHGIAVHATRGHRSGYLPLKTPLAPSSDPVAVALGLRSVFAFPTLYVADLDGIEGRGRNLDLPAKLAQTLPDVTIWIDDGASPRDAADRMRCGGGATVVLGSENVSSAPEVATLRSMPVDSYVLSLDFKEDRFAGAPTLVEDARHWPDRVIVMTLARVGSNEGPDIARVAGIVDRSGGRQVFAAGGVRNLADVEALRSAGAAGVLVATALHAGTLTAGDLEKIAGR